MHQYYYVNQGPTYTGPGNFAPYPGYEEGALPGWGLSAITGTTAPLLRLPASSATAVHASARPTAIATTAIATYGYRHTLRRYY